VPDEVNAKSTLPDVNEVYKRLSRHHGAQNWWPAEHAFEVIVGAILTQNTAWTNVELALANLRNHNRLSCASVLAISSRELQDFIRPAGFYRRKSDCLQTVCRWLEEAGGIDKIKLQSQHVNRTKLLSISGIGEETADAILLYAFDQPAFVIDKYTLRIMSRLGFVSADCNYQELQAIFMSRIEVDLLVFQEFHALLVEHAKQHCRKTSACEGCPLSDCCRYQKGFIAGNQGHIIID